MATAGWHCHRSLCYRQRITQGITRQSGSYGRSSKYLNPFFALFLWDLVQGLLALSTILAVVLCRNLLFRRITAIYVFESIG